MKLDNTAAAIYVLRTIHGEAKTSSKIEDNPTLLSSRSRVYHEFLFPAVGNDVRDVLVCYELKVFKIARGSNNPFHL